MIHMALFIMIIMVIIKASMVAAPKYNNNNNNNNNNNANNGNKPLSVPASSPKHIHTYIYGDSVEFFQPCQLYISTCIDFFTFVGVLKPHLFVPLPLVHIFRYIYIYMHRTHSFFLSSLSIHLCIRSLYRFISENQSVR